MLSDRDGKLIAAASHQSRSAFEDTAVYLGLSTVRAYQILNRLLDDPEASQQDGRTVDFWRGVRDGAREMRNAA